MICLNNSLFYSLIIPSSTAQNSLIPLKKLLPLSQAGLQQLMDKKKLWILGEEAVQRFDAYRQERYAAAGLKDIDDHIMTNYYLKNIIRFLRSKKNQKSKMFNNEELIHTAVSLFRRFYLVNEYRKGEEPSQICWVCIYLALKIDEIFEGEIELFAKAWKLKKGTSNLYNPLFKHFMDPGYTEIELQFLKGFGFQLGKSPLIPSIESLYHRCEKNEELAEHTIAIRAHIQQFLQKIYLHHSLLFVYPGPKIALAVVMVALEEVSRGLDKFKILREAESFGAYLGEDIEAILKKHWSEIECIMNKVKEIPEYSVKENEGRLVEMRKNFRTQKKKNYEWPRSKSSKSPKIQPLSGDLPPF